MSDWKPNDPRKRYEEIDKILAKIKEMVVLEKYDYDEGLQEIEKFIDIWYERISICKRTTNRGRVESAWKLYHEEVITGKFRIREVHAHGNYQSFSKAQEIPLENPEELV
jgi:hypothetical protein